MSSINHTIPPQESSKPAPPPPSYTPPPRAEIAARVDDLLLALGENPDEVLHPRCLHYDQACTWLDLNEGPASEANLAAFTAAAFANVRSYERGVESGRTDDIAYDYVGQTIERYPTPGERHAAMVSVIEHLVDRLAKCQLPSTEAAQ